ncbi:MAG TPA: DUF5681 domain-containing protein [Candidatus Angelobacter sp.]|nr:DUF5681 domain-containing protein [Candidatus Angelobacter sp.]
MPANHREKTGYCNPPQHSRFKKGQSGNPKGRPKGRPNLATVLENTLREKVVIRENGRRKTITKFEAALKQLVNQATSGNLRAVQQLVTLACSAEGPSPESGAATDSLAEVDRKVLAGVLGRWGANFKGAGAG